MLEDQLVSTEAERIVRWKVLGAVAIAAIAAGLVAYGVMTGAEWASAVGNVVRGLFGA